MLRLPVHPHIRGVYWSKIARRISIFGPSPHTWGLLSETNLLLVQNRSIPTYVGFTLLVENGGLDEAVHPHIRGVFVHAPHLKGGVQRSIPTYVGFSSAMASKSGRVTVHPHIRGVFITPRQPMVSRGGPSPHTWGFRFEPVKVRVVFPVHPHIRGVFTEIKSKISRASSKTALLPAEKFKILFLVKIKSSAAAFQVHTIFRDQFPPGLHFEIALHL